MTAPDGPRVVAVGGGHGLAATLRAARTYAGELTAVVSVADNGGSSGRLRAAVPRPAPGDLRKCLVALAGEPSSLSRVMEHRFGQGEMAGHAFGNLFIAALEESEGDLVTALDEIGRILGTVGRVLPTTTVPVELVAEVAVGGSRVGSGRGAWPGRTSSRCESSRNTPAAVRKRSMRWRRPTRSCWVRARCTRACSRRPRSRTSATPSPRRADDWCTCATSTPNLPRPRGSGSPNTSRRSSATASSRMSCCTTPTRSPAARSTALGRRRWPRGRAGRRPRSHDPIRLGEALASTVA